MLAITAKDDPITPLRYVPIGDLNRNPNIMLCLTDYGGHCDFFETKDMWTYERMIPKLAMTFIDELNKN